MPSDGILEQTTPRSLLTTKKSDQAHLVLGYRGYPRDHEDRYIAALLSVVLGGGMSSRLFSEVREKRGLAYAVSTSTENYMDTGYFGTYAGVKIDSIDEAIEVIRQEHENISNSTKSITSEEEKRAKEYLKGRLALSLEDTEAVNTFFGVEELLVGKERTPSEVYEKIDKVTITDMDRVAKDLFKKEKLNLTVIGPYTDQERFLRLVQ